MESFIRSNFEIGETDGQITFKSRNNPESWTFLQPFLDIFGDCQPNYSSLLTAVGNSGFQEIFDEWLQEGIIS